MSTEVKSVSSTCDAVRVSVYILLVCWSVRFHFNLQLM